MAVKVGKFTNECFSVSIQYLSYLSIGSLANQEYPIGMSVMVGHQPGNEQSEVLTYIIIRCSRGWLTSKHGNIAVIAILGLDMRLYQGRRDRVKIQAEKIELELMGTLPVIRGITSVIQQEVITAGKSDGIKTLAHDSIISLVELQFSIRNRKLLSTPKALIS